MRGAGTAGSDGLIKNALQRAKYRMTSGSIL